MSARFLAGCLLLLGARPAAAASPPAPVQVKVTQRYLAPLCLDGAAVPAGRRSWALAPGPHALSFTMRAGAADPAVDPKVGAATVSFTLEAGHRYEVEVRAPAESYSSRTWERGQWKPVVRDRTVDHLVSAEPAWTDGGCTP